MMSAAKYHTLTGGEGEFQPGSRRRVLKNRLGIASKQEMDLAEFEALIEAQSRYLDLVKEDTVFSARTLCQMHKELVG